MIKNPNPPSSLGITDFGFNIPWASVLLVLLSEINALFKLIRLHIRAQILQIHRFEK